MNWFIFELFRVYFLRFWIDLGAIEVIDQVQPSFAFEAAFWSLSIQRSRVKMSVRESYRVTIIDYS